MRKKDNGIKLLPVLEDKPAFLFYLKWFEKLEKITDLAERWKVMKVCELYWKDKENVSDLEKTLSPVADAIWSFMKDQFDRDCAEYVKEANRREMISRKNTERIKEYWADIKSKPTNTVVNGGKPTNTVVNGGKQVNDNLNVNDNYIHRDNVKENHKQKQNQTQREKAGVNVDLTSLSENQKKFYECFPKKEIDADLVEGQNIDALIEAIKKSDFLPKADNLKLSFFVKYYDEILDGKYDDFSKNKQKLKEYWANQNVKDSSFKGRDYSKGELNALFDSIDKIEV